MHNINNITVTMNEKANDYEKPTAGMVDAICCGIWNVGLQKVEYKKLGVVKYQEQIAIGFILSQLSERTGLPMLQYETYGLSLFEKSKLYKMIQSWTSKNIDEKDKGNYDLSPFVGKKATLNLIQNNEYINIGAVLPAQESNKVELVELYDSGIHPYVQKKLDRSEQAVLEKQAEEINVSEIKPLESEKAPF